MPRATVSQGRGELRVPCVGACQVAVVSPQVVPALCCSGQIYRLRVQTVAWLWCG